MNIELKRWDTGDVIWSGEAKDIRDALEKAVAERKILYRAALSWNDLDGARLDGARLDGARLVGASLVGARLDGASLDSIREDYFAVLRVARAEVVHLYKALCDGRINGSVYDGECACLVGTIANARHERPFHLSIDLQPNASRPAERWFLAIQKGHTPEGNPVAEITKAWTEEFMRAENIAIPTCVVTWSDA